MPPGVSCPAQHSWPLKSLGSKALGSHCIDYICCIQYTYNVTLDARKTLQNRRGRDLRAMLISPLNAIITEFVKTNTYHEPWGTRRTCPPRPTWQPRNAILPRQALNMWKVIVCKLWLQTCKTKHFQAALAFCTASENPSLPAQTHTHASFPYCLIFKASMKIYQKVSIKDLRMILC